MTSLVGKQLDRYEVVDEIGSGAVGRVYLAQDPLIGRLVAIKAFEPRNGKKAPAMVANGLPALHEARAAGILSHPNIVTIHDVVDRHEGTVPFIAMEYVRGTDLKEILAPGKPVPLDFAISVVNQVAAALDYAHRNGVIHGDVKPANILITEDETVKITDFGVARKKDDQNDGHVHLMGTPSYVAPEQILTGDVDHRADFFALGVVLHELLTGRLPYRGRTSEEILHEIAEEPVMKIRTNGHSLSPGVEHVLAKALEKSPSQRFGTAGELAEALAREAALDETSSSESATTGIIAVATRPEKLRPKDPKARFGLFVDRVRRRSRDSWLYTRERLYLEWIKTPKRRLAILASVAVVVPAVLGGAALLAVSSHAPESVVPEQEHQLRVRYVPLLQEGHRKIISGDPEGAATAYRRAEEVAPDVPSLSRYREQAEMEAADTASYAEIELRIQDLMSQGLEAMEAGRLSLSRSLAAEVLALDPEREAAQWLASSSAVQAPVPRPSAPMEEKIEAQPLEMPAAASAGRAAGSDSPSTAAQDPLVAASPARLRIDFFSHAPRGVLTLYSDTDQILRHPFKFVRKKGIFRRKGISGRYESTLDLPAGETELKIYVTAGSKSAELATVSLRMEAGRTRHLRVVVDEKGEVTANLD